MPTPAPPSGSRAVGAWSEVASWPLISIHAALLPDGRVMTYGTDYSSRGYGRFLYDVFDPSEPLASSAAHMTLENVTGTFLFCGSQVLLPESGELLLSGGDLLVNGRAQNRGVSDTNIFSPSDDRLRPASAMKRPRWYATSTALPNGEIYLQGGVDGEDHPEIRGTDGTFRLLDGINTLKTHPNGSPYFKNNYPRNFVARNGKVFGLDHDWMYQVDPRGTGDNGKPGVVSLIASTWDIPTAGGQFVDRGWAASSSIVMFRPGKILQAGGTRPNATIIDIADDTGSTAPVTPRLIDLAPMSQTRQWANATLMADGKVLVSGGSSKNLLTDPSGNDTGTVAYDTEIFDPQTASWSRGAPLTVGRFYHSVTLLLPDGSILSSGGGSPGPLTNLNAQVYYPGYFYNSDGSPARRPVIDQADPLPPVVNPGKTFNLSSADAARIRRVTMVKSGSVTHSFDMDQRFVEPAFTVSGSQVIVTLPPNPFDTPPGYYMVFIIDDNGTPSRARMIRVNPFSG